MTQQLNIFFLSFGALQGALLSFLLLRKRKGDPSRIFFAIFLIVIGVQLTFKIFTKAWLWYNVQLLYLLSYSLPLLVGPLVYLFLRTRYDVRQPGRIDILHGVPFTIFFLNTLSGELLDFYLIPGYLWILPFPTYHLISLYAYGVVGWKVIRVASDEAGTRELKKFLAIVIAVETIILIAASVMLRYSPDSLPDLRWLFVSLTLMIYWISYKLFEKPELFAGMIKYKNSGLKVEEADRIEAMIRVAIYEQHVFLDPSISVENFAGKLKVPKHHLSRVINERFRKTFNELVNGWRLEEARTRLEDSGCRHLAISTIAFDCGFGSVPSFNTMFRRKFQCTPSAYRELHGKADVSRKEQENLFRP